MDFVSKVVGKDSSSAVKIGLLVTAVLASGALAYSYFGSSKGSDLPAVTQEEAREMMQSIVDKIKVMIPKMVRAAEGIKQQLAQQGQQIDDMQLMKAFILPHVDNQLKEIQQSVLDQYEFDDDELEEACDYYIKAGDDVLAEHCKKIKNIYKEFGGDVAADEADEPSQAAQDMSVDDILAMMESLAEKMATSTDIYCQQYVDNFGSPSSQKEMEQFQMGLMQVAEGAESEVLSEKGLTPQDFQALLIENQTNHKMVGIFTEMQYTNKRILAKHGINVGM